MAFSFGIIFFYFIAVRVMSIDSVNFVFKLKIFRVAFVFCGPKAV